MLSMAVVVSFGFTAVLPLYAWNSRLKKAIDT